MTRTRGGVRVLIVAASAIRREGLESMLSRSSAVKFIGSIGSYGSLSEQLRQIQPEVVLMDLPEPDSQFLAALRSLPPHASGIVVLADEPDAEWSARALRDGVRAILPRECSRQEIELAIHAAQIGLSLLEPEFVAELTKRWRTTPDEAVPRALGELTAREVEVLRLLAEGLGNKEIADRLGISDHTVKFHISSILSKLGASTRTEAVTLGIRMGLIVL